MVGLWSSCTLPKKNGEVRVCVDYRALNAVTKIPAIPIPRTKELLQRMAGNQFYHSFDLSNGYHNLQIDAKDQAKTAIVLPDDLGLPARLFQFTRLAFGLSSAPGIFQSVTDRLVTPAKSKTTDNDIGEKVACYLDDICLAGESFEEIMQKIVAFFNRIRAAGFLLKAKKCELFQESVEY